MDLPKNSVKTTSDVAPQHKYTCPKGNHNSHKETAMKKRLRDLWNSFMCMPETFGRARAASSLARHGQYKLAQQLMSEKCDCC
jgi:hypothetical protein